MFFFFFNDTATTEIYTLPLHDALPIYGGVDGRAQGGDARGGPAGVDRGLVDEGVVEDADAARGRVDEDGRGVRSEEHTSELQSRQYLVCRLLLEKKKKTTFNMSGSTNR